MRNNYLQLKDFLERRYPALIGNVHGSFYPPPPYTELLASLASYVWMFGLGFLFFGEQLFAFLNINVPDWYQGLKQNQMPVLVGLFLLNNIAANLTRTGAFEVYLDDHLLFSKLESSRMPSPGEIVAAMNQLGFR